MRLSFTPKQLRSGPVVLEIIWQVLSFNSQDHASPPARSPGMDKDGLALYLKDHCSASVGALELIAHLKKSDPPPPEAQLLDRLEGEITSEQSVLADLITALDSSRNQWTDAGAWLAEKAGFLKLWIAKCETPPVFWLQAFETLALGIRGKSALWTLLKEADNLPTGSESGQYQALLEQSQVQESLVEEARLRAGLRLLHTTA